MIKIITIINFTIIIICVLLVIDILLVINTKLAESNMEYINLKDFINDLLSNYNNINSYIITDVERVFFSGNYAKVKRLFNKIINIIGEENIVFRTEKRKNNIRIILEDKNNEYNYKLINLIEKINFKLIDSGKIRFFIEGKSDLGVKLIICFI